MPKRVAVEISVRFGKHGVVHKMWLISWCCRTRCTVLYYGIKTCTCLFTRITEMPPNYRTTKMRYRLVEPRSPKWKSRLATIIEFWKINLFFFVYQNYGAPKEKQQNRKSNSDHDPNIGSPRLEKGRPKFGPFVKFSSIFVPRQQLRHISSKRINNVPYLNTLKRGHFRVF